MHRLLLSGSTRNRQSTIKTTCSECSQVFVSTNRRAMQCESCTQKLLAEVDVTHLADWELSMEKELTEVAIGEFHDWAKEISTKLKGPCPGEE